MTSSMKDHWNKIYTRNAVTQLGWYEAWPFPSAQLIERCVVPKDSPVVDIGSGISTLIPYLLEASYQNLYAIDISEVALDKARALLGEERAAQVHWMVDDITHPSAVLQLKNVAVWHDRAVFHFLTEEAHRQTYYSVLLNVLMPGGFVILAAFASNGAERCSGLPVQRYSVENLCGFLGDGFRLVESLDYTYQMPSGDLRPYVYTRFQKI